MEIRIKFKRRTPLQISSSKEYIESDHLQIWMNDNSLSRNGEIAEYKCTTM